MNDEIEVFLNKVNAFAPGLDLTDQAFSGAVGTGTTCTGPDGIRDVHQTGGNPI